MNEIERYHFYTNDWHLWEVEYFIDGELRTTYIRSKTALEALLWLESKTDGKADTVKIMESGE